MEKDLAYFNTSYVVVQAVSKKGVATISGLFQYILCCCSRFISKAEFREIQQFQYILCCCSRG